ncbi:MAG TPA: TIR domain-containing protein [Bradyrhizobium sp.]|jgi:hypothetical protein
MKPRYVDVFISHKSDDAGNAQRLKTRIVDEYRMSCWIDADDEEMQRIQNAKPVDYRLLTDRIRENLRTCRCLIFAYSAKSQESRWMPWELGFFDGRWGRRLIGLYDLDERRKGTSSAAQSDGHAGIPEFAQIYSELTPDTLAGFLDYARSPRALSDRADVDIDRWANLVAGTLRDPVNASIDAMQFWIAYQQALLNRAAGGSGFDLGQPLLAFTEAMRTALGPLGKMMPPAFAGGFDAMIQGQAAASNDAQAISRGPALHPAGLAQAFAMPQLPLGGLES